MEIDDDGRPKDKGVHINYGQSKVGNLFLTRELARTTPQTGVIHACFNPGSLRTELQRHWKGLASWIAVSGFPATFSFTANLANRSKDKLLFYSAIHGAYTEL